jgi:DNA-binding CsgD family transcriptional regulator
LKRWQSCLPESKRAWTRRRLPGRQRRQSRDDPLGFQPSRATGARIEPGPLHPRQSPDGGAQMTILTRREREVLRLVGDFLSDREIAERLSISTQTVSWHLMHANAKLGTHDRFAALREAERRGLLTEEYRPFHPVRIEGDIAYITIFRQGRELTVKVSSVDATRVVNHPYRWHSLWCKTSRTYYVVSMSIEDGKHKHFSLHRFLMDFPEGVEIDHRDGNGLNNTRENLRVVSKSQNLQNQRLTSRASASGMRNVCRKRDKWIVRLMIDGKDRSFGTFSTVDEAVIVASEARRKHFSHCPENSREVAE